MAEALYRKSAEQGNAKAQGNLGYLYSKGLGVSQDYQEAGRWYHKSAEQGHSFAEFNLGMMYEHGNGYQRDYKKAVGWYRKAAEHGHSAAQGSLSFYYMDGVEVPKDWVVAYALLNLALADNRLAPARKQQFQRVQSDLAKGLNSEQLAEAKSLLSHWNEGEPLPLKSKTWK